MEFQETRIYKAIVQEPFHKVAGKIRELTETGRDVNIRDSAGLTFLHYVLDHVTKFSQPRAVPVIYQLALAGIDIDARDTEGETCLHRAVRREGAWRVVVALIRCGADPGLRNYGGQTPETILLTEKPPGCQETLYWLRRYTPGLRVALHTASPDCQLVEWLLKSWCRTTVYMRGQMVNLATWARDNSLPSQVVDLLDKYGPTNELATAALAGSAKRVLQAGKEGQADINTKDVSYQYNYPNSPEVAQPLLAAAWEQDSYDVIDALMSLNTNTSVMYANHRNMKPKPLFFHAISGRPRPEKIKIVHRILRGSDLQRKNHKGQTVIFEAMAEKMSHVFITALLHYGLDLSARDYKGRSPRDYAETLGEEQYVRCIDYYVLEAIRSGLVDKLEHWVLRGYDHISCVLRNDTEDGKRLCEKLKDDRLLKQTGALIASLPKTKRRIRKTFEALDAGNMSTLDKVAEGQVSRAQNLCGHSLLHRALLSRQNDVIKHLISRYSHLVAIPDNMLRTPLHYAYILYGEESEIIEWLTSIGASNDDVDVAGLTPSQYSLQNTSTFEHNTLLKEVTEFESRVYLREVGFEDSLYEAIEAGDMQQVVSLMSMAAKHATTVSYSDVLFECIDKGQPDIAAYLIKCGYNPDIWKQYQSCNPVEDDCAMQSCKHEMTSLEDRARQNDFVALANYISKLRQSRVSESPQASDASHNCTAAVFQQMANFVGPS